MQNEIPSKDTSVLVSVGSETFQILQYTKTAAAAVTTSGVHVGAFPRNTPANVGVCRLDAVANQHLPASYLGAASVSSVSGSIPIDLVRCHVKGKIRRRNKPANGGVGFNPHALASNLNRLPVEGRRGIRSSRTDVSRSEAIAALLKGKCPPSGLVACDIAADAVGLHVWKWDIPCGLFQLRAYTMHPMPLHVAASLGLLRSLNGDLNQDTEDTDFMVIKEGAPDPLSLVWHVFGGPKPLHVLSTPSEHEVCAWVLDNVTDESVWELVGDQLRHKTYYSLWHLASYQAADVPPALVCRNLRADADLELIPTTVSQGVSVQLEITGPDVSVAGMVRLLSAMPTNTFCFTFGPECRTILHVIVTFRL